MSEFISRRLVKIRNTISVLRIWIYFKINNQEETTEFEIDNIFLS